MIKITTVNVNGFRSREDQIRNYLANEGECVLALNDTRLNQNITNLAIPGYRMLRKDKVFQGPMSTAGGVAIIIPQKWTCLRVDLTTGSDDFEALAVIIIPSGKNSKPFKLMSVYNHPRNYVPRQLLVEYDEIRFNGNQLPGLLLGDFNCPHAAFGSRTTDEFGSRLLQNLNQENLIYFNDGTPTYNSNSTGLSNVLDLVIGDQETSRLVQSCIVSGDIGSDHLPITTTLSFRVAVNIREKLNMNSWECYKPDFDQHPCP